MLESMGFEPGNIPATWRATMDGIRFSICEHPLQGIAISFWHVGGRTASEGEVFVPKDADIQKIAQALVQVHARVFGSPLDPEDESKP